jgi:putative two-component system response regulator
MHAIQCLGKAAEYRDNETGMHVVRMSKTSARIAKELGWDDDQCDLILHASPMHDIGKIGIPDHILLKPGELDIDEWEIMQSHTSIGGKILSTSGSDLFRAAAEIAETHHEKWDGSGYPEGLIGEEIPIMSRIVAVSDTFDALISERPYKKPWPVQEAVTYVRENSGKHFDPEVIEAFTNCLEDILAICESHSDNPEKKEKKSFFPEIDTLELDQVGGVA